MIKVSILNESFIHKEVLFATGFLSHFGLPHEAFYLNDSSAFINSHHSFIIKIPKERNDPLFEGAWNEMVYINAIMIKSKTKIRMSQSHTLEFIKDMAGFDRITLQKIAPCRDI